MNTNVTIVTRFNGMEVYSFSRELCREQSCQFNIDFSSGSQTADTVYISLSNSLMASSNQTIPGITLCVLDCIPLGIPRVGKVKDGGRWVRECGHWLKSSSLNFAGKMIELVRHFHSYTIFAL